MELTLLAAEIKKRGQGLMEVRGGLLQKELLVVLVWIQDHGKRRTEADTNRGSLLQYIPLMIRQGWAVETNRRGMGEVLEHWLCRGVLGGVSPPLSDTVALDKHHQFTAHLANEGES